MNIVICDGQGGRLGAMLVEAVRGACAEHDVTAIGTNSMATAAMLKAGANQGATGENPLVVACRGADVIMGPVGILAADAMLGEVTPRMSVAVGQSRAVKLLLPVNMCSNIVVGMPALPFSKLVAFAMEELEKLS